MDVQEDVIVELLFTDVDTESNLSSSEHSTTPDPTIREDDITYVTQVLNPDFTLSQFGLQKVTTWIMEFAKNKNEEHIIKQYPLICTNASSFFLSKIENGQASVAILSMMKQIVKPIQKESTVLQTEITELEQDVIEYIGGFTLKKASKKFENDYSVINSFCTTNPSGSMIPLLEQRIGSLRNPSTEYHHLLLYTYNLVKQQCSDISSVDFKKITCKILHDVTFSHFVDRIVDRSEVENNVVLKLTTYLVTLFIRLLSYAFSKKLFERLSKTCNRQTHSLRKELNKM